MKNINHLNTFFIILSLVVAFIIPFELLLFSYAVLGPLHYLTEIAWLKDRGYFIDNKNKAYFLYLIIFILVICSGFFIHIEFLSKQYILFLSLSFLAVYLFFKKTFNIIEIFAIIIIAAILVTQNLLTLLLSLYLFTLIHVYIFTGEFMLVGTLKSRQGWLNILLFTLAPCIFILNYYMQIIPLSYHTHELVQSTYTQTFGTLSSLTLREIMGLNDTQVSNLFNSKESLAFTQFVSFAYTYHYLNWFSKTQIIGWHKNKYLSFTIILWLLAVAIYFYDYMTGYKVLFILSMSHVVLEFPLNQKVTKEIIQYFRK